MSATAARTSLVQMAEELTDCLAIRWAFHKNECRHACGSPFPGANCDKGSRLRAAWVAAEDAARLVTVFEAGR